MAINNDIMINAIQNEVNQKGRTFRLLPKDYARELFTALKRNGYVRQANNVLVNNYNKVSFFQTSHNRIRINAVKL